MDKVAQTCVEYLRFAASLNRQQRTAMNSVVDRQGAILSYVLQTCERYGHHDIVDKYLDDYDQYVK